jgi:hypothetical protein
MAGNHDMSCCILDWRRASAGAEPRLGDSERVADSDPHSMPNASDFVLASCQATLFTPVAEVSAVRLLTKLLPDWVDRFDADPMVLPLPEAVPKEVPRLMLSSRSEEWKCEIAPGCMNLIWQKTTRAAEPTSLAERYGMLIPLLAQYAAALESRVGRLAAVISRYVEHGSPARLLASHFCKEEWLQALLNRPDDFELHAHKVFLLGGRFQVNSWVRNKTGVLNLPGDEAQKPVVLAEQDFNTLAEEQATRNFATDEISAFFRAAAVGFDETLRLYYPSDARV